MFSFGPDQNIDVHLSDCGTFRCGLDPPARIAAHAGLLDAREAVTKVDLDSEAESNFHQDALKSANA